MTEDEDANINLHQFLQLVELAVKIFKVVLVESSEAVLIHDFHQHAEGLLLRHLEEHSHFNIHAVKMRHFRFTFLFF